MNGRVEDIVHVLNGDALLQRFPNEIEGKIIVARECLIEGDLRFDSLDNFMKIRGEWLTAKYQDYASVNYVKNVASQFEKLRMVPPNSVINLWFEDDLFCQTNMWFVVWIINNYNKNTVVNWVRTDREHPYSFGHMDEEALLSACSSAQQIENSELMLLNDLWIAYTMNDHIELKSISEEIQLVYPSIASAVTAHIKRTPTIKNQYGLPEQILIDIKRDLTTEDFTLIFQEFVKRAGIYGFGDIQVKELLKNLDS